MDLLEIGAIAQVLRAIAILLSLIIVIRELRNNLEQNNIANSLVRAVEREKFYYMQMDEAMAKVVVKARETYERLDDVEKSNLRLLYNNVFRKFSGFSGNRRVCFFNRAKELRGRVKARMTDFFESRGV
tara:strand:- start:322 stop:708 length:387 start_codon:yes stop_codon:yes gene_type:complete